MARGRGGKALNNNSIVIVCEGTETEFPYFQEMCKFTSLTWRIVPVPSERVDAEAKAVRQSVMRTLQDGDPSVFTGPEYYVGLAEVDQATYEKFRSEPTRWVRAAQLYKDREGYYEAWAVYDLDQGRDEAHPEAYDLAKKVDNLHIAFSAYSFEEWLLLHFERNPKAFWQSDGADGEDSIGGYLREIGFIPEYAKKDGAKMVAITREKLHVAYVNAAWSRSLSSNEVYKRNPYTDVDKLVMRLLQDEYEIKWLKSGDIFEHDDRKYRIDIVDGTVQLIIQTSGKTGLIPAAKIFWCDLEYNMLQSACPRANFVFPDANSKVELCNKPEETAVLCITDNNRTAKREYYIEC